ncbi:MAG TPA: hypothetical protein VMW42_05015, partial [Desulfatiglandales bacterium]|nr:hypothetical protein [Desulfatiglandales bacterium]
ELFFHNEDNYNSYLINKISEKETVWVNEEKKITGKKLYSFLHTLTDYNEIVKRLTKKGYSERFLNVLFQKEIDKNYLKDKDFTVSLSKELKEEEFNTEEMLFDGEHNRYELLLSDVKKNGSFFKLNWEFINSPEFKKLLMLNKESRDLSSPFFLVGDEKDKTKIETKEELFSYLINKIKKGTVIQRYKGLGEMNPGQLWHTTMDPERRSLVRVTIEDAIAADEIFTLLMGDKVEPRREFIQNNALEVKELDI